jgi:hypothetical protein
MVVALLPGATQLAHGLTQTNGKLSYRLQPFDGGRRQAVAARQEHFGVAEYTCQRVIHFMTKQFAEILDCFSPRGNGLNGKRVPHEFDNVRHRMARRPFWTPWPNLALERAAGSGISGQARCRAR